jgi:hypothetical protein
VDALLAGISIVSFLLGIASRYQARREKERAAAAASIVSQRIDSAAVAFEGVFAAVNAIVQVPKTREVSVAELQDSARVARAQVLVSAKILKEADELMALWRTGDVLSAVTGGRESLRSDTPPDELVLDER